MDSIPPGLLLAVLVAALILGVVAAALPSPA
jgi:hypothetical protein